jgi:ribosomal-protein-alanine N-acetyltransferase
MEKFLVQIPDTITARLRLVAITPSLLDIQEGSPHLLGETLGANIPACWPNSDWEPHVYAFIRKQLQTHPDTIGWHRYILLTEGESFTLIGSLGSHPLNETEAELGYGILEPWQNRGFATEAARALIEYLFRAGRQRIRAQTFPHLEASQRVMKKCGMQPAGPGDEAGTVCYAISSEKIAGVHG